MQRIVLFLLFHFLAVVITAQIKHASFISAGITKPFERVNSSGSLYSQQYKTNFISKFNHSLSFKRIGLGIEASYYTGFLVETEHISYEGFGEGVSITFPLSYSFKLFKKMELMLYGAFGQSRFSIPARTRYRKRGNEIVTTRFPVKVENIPVFDLGFRFLYHLPNRFFIISSINYQGTISILQSSFQIPQINLGLGYRWR